MKKEDSIFYLACIVLVISVFYFAIYEGVIKPTGKYTEFCEQYGYKFVGPLNNPRCSKIIDNVIVTRGIDIFDGQVYWME